MKNSYCYFENRDCEYYPCHKGAEALNCLFCYCPLYTKENCPGSPSFIECGGRQIKDCSRCVFPHQPENYEVLVKYLQEKQD